MEFIEVSAKTVSEAITEACQKLGVTSDKLEYEVLEEGSAGFLGFGAKAAKIKASVKLSVEDNAKNFLKEVFEAMDMEVVIEVKYDENERAMDIDLVRACERRFHAFEDLERHYYEYTRNIEDEFKTSNLTLNFLSASTTKFELQLKEFISRQDF